MSVQSLPAPLPIAAPPSEGVLPAPALPQVPAERSTPRVTLGAERQDTFENKAGSEQKPEAPISPKAEDRKRPPIAESLSGLAVGLAISSVYWVTSIRRLNPMALLVFLGASTIGAGLGALFGLQPIAAKRGSLPSQEAVSEQTPEPIQPVEPSSTAVGG